MFDKNKDDQIDSEEWAQVFAHMDLKHRGFLGIEDFQFFFNIHASMICATPQKKKSIMPKPQNQNGIMKALADIYFEIDTDRSGFISQDDMQLLYAKTDLNNNGEVSLVEFKQNFD